MGPLLQGFLTHPAGTGIKAWLFLTCLLAGGPHGYTGWAHCQPRQEGTGVTLSIQGGEAFGQPCTGYAAHCTAGETESQGKKKGLSPGHTARTEVSCSLQSSLPSVQVFGKALEVCSIPEPESQVEEKQANCPL